MPRQVRASFGAFAQLVRPLDCLEVADHAENIGLAPAIAESNRQLRATPWGRDVHDRATSGDLIGAYLQWGEPMMVRSGLIVEPGTIDIMVGSSSADIRPKEEVMLTCSARKVGRDRKLTTQVTTS